VAENRRHAIPVHARYIEAGAILAGDGCRRLRLARMPGPPAAVGSGPA